MVTDYSAAKAAFNNLAKALSIEFGPKNIRINAICPGIIETDMWAYNDQAWGKLLGTYKPGELMAAKINPRSRNELDQLALATERLRVSINMAIQRLTKRSS